MPATLKQLSVFFPCYNEAKNIKTTVDKAIPLLKNYQKMGNNHHK